MNKKLRKSITVSTIFLFLLTLSLPSVAKEDITLNEEDSSNPTILNATFYEQEVDMNDLVFRGMGMDLFPNATISFDLQQIDSVYDEVLSIVVRDCNRNEIVKTMNMEYGSVFYIVEQKGMYTVLALVKDNDGEENWIDITSKAIIDSKQEYTPIGGDSAELFPLPLVSEQTE